MAENREMDILRKKVQELEDKEAIRDVLANYAFNVDMCRYDDFVNLWTEDGLFITDALGDEISNRGREAIKTYLEGALPDSHACTQHLQLDYVITVNGDTATALGYQLITSSKTETPGIHRCAMRTFTFNRVDGKWLIKKAVSRAIHDDAACQKLLPPSR